MAGTCGGLRGELTLWVTGISNSDGCTGTNLVHLAGDLAGHKNMVAAVMTAYASGKKVGLWSTGCVQIPFWGGGVTYPIVHDLWVTEVSMMHLSNSRRSG